ncbi:hypothetical protein GCM10022256_13590 [Frondihabitans peucedani]|uniref:Uncharacterized protein n=1 Tax=Frondihabitans peucedani TaxID=598626 RepID=A0ABP8E0L9_9MICO
MMRSRTAAPVLTLALVAASLTCTTEARAAALPSDDASARTAAAEFTVLPRSVRRPITALVVSLAAMTVGLWAVASDPGGALFWVAHIGLVVATGAAGISTTASIRLSLRARRGT